MITNRHISNILKVLGIFTKLVLLCLFLFNASNAFSLDMEFFQVDTTEKDTSKIILKYPFKDKSGEGLNGGNQEGGLYLHRPSNIQGEFVYDPETDSYIYRQKMGDRDYRHPEFMTLEEYRRYEMKNSDREFFREKSKEEDIGDGSAFRPKLYVESKTFDRIFGGNTIDIRPQGSAEISFGLNTTRRDNPAIPENQRKTTNFDFDEKIQLNVVGSVGDKLKISTSYNTEATFDFENQTKIEYSGYEDEIIQKIELGNVSLPLQGSLIQGSQTLFGIKTELKFGRLRITSILSQEKGERKEVNSQGGSQTLEFLLSGADYEDNQHYFLGHYFRDKYNKALADLPNVISSFRINKVDVWITQIGGQIQNSRNVIAFTDLGESNGIQLSSQNPNYQNMINPSGSKIADNFRSNDLYGILTDSSSFPLSINEKAALRSYRGALQVLTGPLGLKDGKDFEVYEAVLLSPSEYSVNEQLGYISLNRQLKPEDILGVAYEYIINDRSYQVGEISNQAGANGEAIYVKLLKSSFTNTSVPMWDLMMKNVYYLNSFGISKDEFRFEIWYLDQEAGVDLPFIADGPINGELLLQVMELDNLDYYNAKHEDGEFDYIEDVTIKSRKGRVYFPVTEPFGSHLRTRLGNDVELGDKYAFDSLYSTTKALAELDANKNRFTIKGSYKSSSSSEIRLNAFNIPQGSVVVTAGGVRLTENVDYTVDYNLGTVKILNQGYLESNTPIKVSLESNSLFNIQTKTLFGSRLDYDFNENLKMGGTVLNLSERPLTNKVNIGDEAISNTIVGLDGSYSTEAPILTKIADALPFFNTKEKSRVNTTAEFAYLFPGNARAITKEGVAYIDDFEGSQSQIDMKSIFTWRLASTPRGQKAAFPEAFDAADELKYGFNRAKLSWYVIDPLFFNPNDDRLPSNITTEMQQNHYMREVLQQEIFPNKSLDQTLIGNIPVLDLTYYPEERGPYNFDPPSGTSVSSGIDPNTGFLRNPESRWGGIMRDINTVDFTESNIEFLQFWVMDPFIESDYQEVFGEPTGKGGFLYLNFGEVSEDILKDGRKSFENGFPWSENPQLVDPTIWGTVPVNKSIVNAFDNLPQSRPDQDVGLDGLKTFGGYNGLNEQVFHEDYLDAVKNHLSTIPEVYQEKYENDPAADNFEYFRDEGDARRENIVGRYKEYNGLEGNSPVNTGSFVASSTTIPDIEDVNRDNTMNTKEAYFQYKIPINKNVFNPDNVGQNYVSNVVTAIVKEKEVHWYQFKIPLGEPDEVIGEINGFKSIRFMRMIMKDFDKPIVLRFAKLDLIRGEWRRYTGDLREDGDYIQGEEDDTKFEVNAVNVEENSSRDPINYVLPPGIERETDYGTANLQQLNEQSLSLEACALNDGAIKAAYRNINLDIRQYKKLKMYVHLEDGTAEQNLNNPLQTGEISLILRMGQDFDENYYEYEIPLKPTDFGANSREAVWPSSNNIEIELDRFTNAKLNRDASGISKTQIYKEKFGAKLIKVKGSPNIANVKLLMIGVKNPKQGSDPDFDDDGLSKCVTVWVNELRVSDFDNSGGWATTASIKANLADLASLTLSGSMSTPGFGSISQKLNERQQETRQAYDFTSNFELGKFTKDALSIPMFFGFSESWDKPRYVPLNPDIELEDVNNSDKFTKKQKDSISRSAVKYRNRKSLNFTNVKVNYGKGGSQKHIYDVQNLSFTYAYDKDRYRDVNLEYLDKTNQKGRILWAYSAKPKSYTPFSRSKWAKSKYLRLIKDFNFYLLPNQYSFTTTVDRGYNEKKLRQTNIYYNPRPYYQKRFNWDRDYALQYSFSKGLKFRYTASNKARIDETDGVVDKGDSSYTRWKETVMKSIREFGTNLKYSQNYTIDYAIPINKFPLTDWLNINTSYNGGYNWDRAAIGSEEFGNTIRNTSSLRYSSSWNLNILYNKIDYLNRLNQSGRGRNKNRIKRSKKKEKEKKEEKRVAAKQALEQKGEAIEEDKKGKKKKDDDDKYRPLKVHDFIFKILTSVKEVSGSYAKSTGTVMPGYSLTNSLLGYDKSWNAPGTPFVLGQKQDTNYVIKSQSEGWLVAGNKEYRYNFENNDGVNYSYRFNIKPVNDMRIELNGTYNYSIGTNMGYTWIDTLRDIDNLILDPLYNQYLFDNAIQTGNFSVSTLTYKTAFVKDDRSNYNSATFDKFNEFRPQASAQLAAERAISDVDYVAGVNSSGYQNEYGSTQQDVLITSFLAAYSGQSEVDIGVRKFQEIFPLPNWRVTYGGLGKIKFLSKYFQSITLNHSYRSIFNIGSFTTNNRISNDTALLVTDVATGNYVPTYQITTVSIVEMFSPLMDIDFNFRFGLVLGFEYRRDRNISLSTVNNQISEVKGREYIVTIGYTFRDVKVSFRSNSKATPKDIITRMDISSRDNFTLLRNIGNDVSSQPGNGQNVLSIKLTADLAINPKFNIRGFYDRIVTNPFISNSFPTASSNFGLSLRFSLAQ